MGTETDSSTPEIINDLDSLVAQISTVAIRAAHMPANDGLRLFVAERFVDLAKKVKRAFEEPFQAPPDVEAKFLSALVMLFFGSRDVVPWLIDYACSDAQFSGLAIRQLAALRVPEVKNLILEKLSGSEARDVDVVDGLLSAWSQFDEPLPDAIRSDLLAQDSLDIRQALSKHGL